MLIIVSMLAIFLHKERKKEMKRIIYRTPTELLERASQRMIPLTCQKQAQQQIATLISMHLNKIQALNEGAEACELVSNSAFLVAPTGCGKSYIVRSLAEVSGLSFAVVDCTSITQTGVRGKNLSHCLTGILAADKFFFEGGIIILDEFDKTFYTGNAYYDAYSVMQDFLKLLEGGNYTFDREGRSETVSLDKTLFLFAGACAKIVEGLKQKYTPSTSGFLAQRDGPRVDVSDYGSLVTLEDLCAYGMMPELCSRINTVIHIPKLDTAAYKRLTDGKEKTAALNKFRNQFGMRGVQLEMTPEAVDRLADLCVERDVGARSVQAILNEQLTSAYRTVDDNLAYGKVVLQTNEDGGFQVEYFEARRTPTPKFKFSETDAKRISLSKELLTDEGINRFCDEFCKCAQMQTCEDEPLFYYFLQTACRFMAYRTRPNEQDTRSLFKLADNTRGGTGGYEPDTLFDIICRDWMDELQKPVESEAKSIMNRVNYGVFHHYLLAFKSEEARNARTASTLNAALSSAQKQYILQHRPNKACAEAAG